MIETTSICPNCYRTVKAVVHEYETLILRERITDVRMFKHCPGCGHSDPNGEIVETSIGFFRMLYGDAPASLYNHLVIDITPRCNLKCVHCYYPVEYTKSAKDVSKDNIINDALCVNLDIILGGGEPTMHPDLPAIIQTLTNAGRSVSIITNALILDDPRKVAELAEAGLVNPDTNTFEAAISLHTPEYNGQASYDRKIRAIKNITSQGYRIGELMFTVTSPTKAVDLIPIIRSFKDVTNRFRVRGPHYNWNQPDNVRKCLHLSELFFAFQAEAQNENIHFDIQTELDNNIYNVTANYGGEFQIRLISCPDERNIILPQLLGCGPFHRANNGELTNFIHSLIINKGMQHGWLHGNKIKS